MWEWFSNLFSAQNAPATTNMLGTMGSAISPQGSPMQKIGAAAADYGTAMQYKNLLGNTGAMQQSQSMPKSLKVDFFGNETQPMQTGQIAPTNQPANFQQAPVPGSPQTPAQPQAQPQPQQAPTSMDAARMLGGQNPFLQALLRQ